MPGQGSCVTLEHQLPGGWVSSAVSDCVWGGGRGEGVGRSVGEHLLGRGAVQIGRTLTAGFGESEAVLGKPDSSRESWL